MRKEIARITSTMLGLEDHLPGRTIYALFEDGAGWSDQPIGIENLPTEAGGSSCSPTPSSRAMSRT